MSNTFFVTTPIYYSNGIPHIGHAYSSFLADTIASYYRLQKVDVKFSTGVDENSQKVVESAAAQGMEVMEYADMMAAKHKAVWDGLNIHYTDFIRTTEIRHVELVQKVLQKSFLAGDIYEWEYEGLYCIGCEAFKKETDLVDEKCPDHPNKPLQHLKEKNYFFRLSKYQDQILKFYEEHPDFVTPKSRYNEIIEFVKGGLEDFSISRETNRFGIPLPFDPEQVTYVWYDALFNYVTVCESPSIAEIPQMQSNSHEVRDEEWAVSSFTMNDETKWWVWSASISGISQWWPADLHVIGKDIVKFHGIYWLAMLWSAGYAAPRQLLTTGYFTVDGQKMSKTIGNVIDPVEYCNTYSRDMLVLYLFTAFPIGEDGDFNQEQAILAYNAKLSNNLGNLLNRLITLSLKIWGQIDERSGLVIAGLSRAEYFRLMGIYDFKNTLEWVFAFSTTVNQFVDEHAPWKIDATSPEGNEELIKVLYRSLAALRVIALMLLPFFGEKMRELLTRIGTPYNDAIPLEQNLEIIPLSFHIREKGDPLYMRVEVKK
jgi:methionyl-tRNA synthetase